MRSAPSHAVAAAARKYHSGRVLRVAQARYNFADDGAGVGDVAMTPTQSDHVPKGAIVTGVTTYTEVPFGGASGGVDIKIAGEAANLVDTIADPTTDEEVNQETVEVDSGKIDVGGKIQVIPKTSAFSAGTFHIAVTYVVPAFG